MWKAAVPGRGHSSPIVWGDRLFLTTAIEGEVVPGAEAVKHIRDGQEFVHPDGVGADRTHTLKVLASTPGPARSSGNGRPGRARPTTTRHSGRATRP